MSEKDNGGAAFPVVHPDGMGVQYFGISVRDYFAAKAMAGLVVGAGFQNTNYSETALARSAYEMADAMLEARK